MTSPRSLEALRGELLARVRGVVGSSVRRLLEPRAVLFRESRALAGETRERLALVEEAAMAAAQRLDRSPFDGRTTIHAAHRKDVRVQAVFARRGLPACLDCAVGADETLAEAAFGEDFALDELLEELNALLDAPTGS